MRVSDNFRTEHVSHEYDDEEWHGSRRSKTSILDSMQQSKRQGHVGTPQEHSVGSSGAAQHGGVSSSSRRYGRTSLAGHASVSPPPGRLLTPAEENAYGSDELAQQLQQRMHLKRTRSLDAGHKASSPSDPFASPRHVLVADACSSGSVLSDRAITAHVAASLSCDMDNLDVLAATALLQLSGHDVVRPPASSSSAPGSGQNAVGDVEDVDLVKEDMEVERTSKRRHGLQGRVEVDPHEAQMGSNSRLDVDLPGQFTSDTSKPWSASASTAAANLRSPPGGLSLPHPASAPHLWPLDTVTHTPPFVAVEGGVAPHHPLGYLPLLSPAETAAGGFAADRSAGGVFAAATDRTATAAAHQQLAGQFALLSHGAGGGGGGGLGGSAGMSAESGSSGGGGQFSLVQHGGGGGVFGSSLGRSEGGGGMFGNLLGRSEGNGGGGGGGLGGGGPHAGLVDAAALRDRMSQPDFLEGFLACHRLVQHGKMLKTKAGTCTPPASPPPLSLPLGHHPAGDYLDRHFMQPGSQANSPQVAAAGAAAAGGVLYRGDSCGSVLDRLARLQQRATGLPSDRVSPGKPPAYGALPYERSSPGLSSGDLLHSERSSPSSHPAVAAATLPLPPPLLPLSSGGLQRCISDTTMLVSRADGGSGSRLDGGPAAGRRTGGGGAAATGAPREFRGDGGRLMATLRLASQQQQQAVAAPPLAPSAAAALDAVERWIPAPEATLHGSGTPRLDGLTRPSSRGPTHPIDLAQALARARPVEATELLHLAQAGAAAALPRAGTGGSSALALALPQPPPALLRTISCGPVVSASSPVDFSTLRAKMSNLDFLAGFVTCHRLCLSGGEADIPKLVGGATSESASAPTTTVTPSPRLSHDGHFNAPPRPPPHQPPLASAYQPTLATAPAGMGGGGDVYRQGAELYHGDSGNLIERLARLQHRTGITLPPSSAVLPGATYHLPQQQQYNNLQRCVSDNTSIIAAMAGRWDGTGGAAYRSSTNGMAAAAPMPAGGSTVPHVAGGAREFRGGGRLIAALAQASLEKQHAPATGESQVLGTAAAAAPAVAGHLSRQPAGVTAATLQGHNHGDVLNASGDASAATADGSSLSGAGTGGGVGGCSSSGGSGTALPGGDSVMKFSRELSGRSGSCDMAEGPIKSRFKASARALADAGASIAVQAAELLSRAPGTPPPPAK